MPFLNSTQRLRSSWIVLWSTNTIRNLTLSCISFRNLQKPRCCSKTSIKQLLKSHQVLTIDEAHHTPNMVHKVEVMTTKPETLASRSGTRDLISDQELHQAEGTPYQTNIHTLLRGTLKHMICRSRLFDQSGCLFGNPANCQVCPVICGIGCATKYAVLRVNCRLCFV